MGSWVAEIVCSAFSDSSIFGICRFKSMLLRCRSPAMSWKLFSRGNGLFTLIDLFAGAGGLSTGLSMAGFQAVFANEISPSYAETLKAAHPNTEVETGDIRGIDAHAIRKNLGLAIGELDLLAGGPPCQGFSINAPTRSSEDQRNVLFRDFLRFSEEFQPKLILIENVPGIISYEKGQTVFEILKSLSNLGYMATVKVLFAAHYGVSQSRWRAIILANRLGFDPLAQYPSPDFNAHGRANFTTNLFGKSVVLDQKSASAFFSKPFNTVEDAIGDLPVLENGGGSELASYTMPPTSDLQRILRSNSDDLFNHHCARLGKANLERLPHIPQGGSWRDIPFDLLPKGMKRARRSDHTKRYGRLHPAQIGSTVLTKCDPHWGTYIHPVQDRVLSVREAARIQSFPDMTRFMGSMTEQYEQVGNAVPPLFAKAIGDRQRIVLEAFANGQSIDGLPRTPWLNEQLSFVI